MKGQDDLDDDGGRRQFTQDPREPLGAVAGTGRSGELAGVLPALQTVDRNFALKAGCTDSEADEVVQETAIGAARHLPEFRYDPKVCRFKTWLLNQTTWRVQDQLKKRHRREAVIVPGGRATGELQPLAHATTKTSVVQQAPDTRPQELDALWDAEWRSHLLAAAVAAVKQRLSAKQWQVFDLSVLKEWPAGEAAKSLGLSVATVYLAKHRVAAAVKREVKRLESEIELETMLKG